MLKHVLGLFLLTAVVVSGSPALAIDEFRNTVRIVGSSTVFPFAAFVAEKYHRKSQKRSPVVESTGSGGGIKLFCSGIGAQTPDIVNASRRMKISEISACAKQKVTQISEIMIGWDGIILAQSVKGAPIALTPRHIWKALAKRLPIDGQLVENPHKLWSHIDNRLPNVAIQVFGPPPTSGTRDVFVEEVMQEGCRGSGYIEGLDGRTRAVVCGELREDGLFIEAGEDDDLIIRRLKTNPKALGILGYNVLERRGNLIRAIEIDGVSATFETIREGIYPLSRPLFLYVKDAHLDVLPEIGDYLNEFMSDASIGEEGYLSEHGLIPLQDGMGQAMKAQVLKLTTQ